MDLLELSIVLVIAGICGAFAELLLGFSPRGMLVIVVSIIVGVIGVFVGILIFERVLALPGLLTIRIGIIRFDLLWTVIGSLLLLLLLQGLRTGGRLIGAR
ncbi:MAG TPA: GlsB/YeaQ/YmgE family stress response membrane protein [Roseiflexaceae bacterium]|nr:GlsB/YeaQ/YmgE family stress response membrane protein [Roseiflexaceae bacterium]HMP39640.1 GlsB/YeaQ/YmgE family stress response membrane protein [Roseiflexaceae bacterium]